MKTLIKYFLLFIALFSFSLQSNAQDQGIVLQKDLDAHSIPLKKTTHIISPEKIEYVDISSKFVEGDLPQENILRLKISDTIPYPLEPFTVTIVTKDFVKTLSLTPVSEDGFQTNTDLAHIVRIDAENAVKLNSLDKVSQQDFNKLAIKIMSEKRRIYNVASKMYGLEFYVNNIFTYGDYILYDVSMKNNTKLTYQLKDVVFRIQDKKTSKSVAQQELEIEPLFSLYTISDVKLRKGEWRNVYLFDRFTYPNDKVLQIEATEKEYSGRKAELRIDYNQVLKSDYLN